MITTTAPGKAVLSGEYVVLRDAPAIAAAVDRRVRVSVAERPGDLHCINAPGYLPGSWYFRLRGDGEFAWRQELPEPSTFSLVEQVWKSFDAAQWPALTVGIDTREFYDPQTGLKLGLGSSAAVAVALTAALRKIASVEGDDREMAIAAHDRFLGGRGSGVDVATSHAGGLIEYRRAGGKARRIGWPQGLCCRYLWSGRAAATAAKLARLGDGSAGTADGMTRLAALAGDIADAFVCGDAGRILESFPGYIDALEQFSIDHDLGIFDAGHDSLARLARDSGLVYKPCGAGGGDIGIVFAACEHDIEEFCVTAAGRGFKILDISLADEGLRLAE